MTSLKRQVARKEKSLQADKAAVRQAAGVLKQSWSRRIASPLVMAGGFGLGFALGWLRPKPRAEAPDRDDEEDRPRRSSHVLRGLAEMGAEIAVPMAVSLLQERLRKGMGPAEAGMPERSE